MSYKSEAGKPQTLRRRELQGLLPLHGHGIDVGAGKPGKPGHDWWKHFPTMVCDPWDKEQGDAHYLKGVPDEYYDWLFSSHCLEHLEDPELALSNWLRVVKPGGWLLISVPHRTLYEGKCRLPSHWNKNHLRYYLPYEGDGADTVGLYGWLNVRSHVTRLFKIETIVTGDWGNTGPATSGKHADGEYQIDALLRKA